MKKYIFLFLCFFLTGCDFKEIRDLSIVSTMGIDFTDGKYEVSVISLSKEEGKSKLYTASGNSFFQAIQGVNDKLTETLYLGHIQNVIVSEDVSKEGLSTIISYFIKEDVIQNNFYLFLARKTSSKDILNYLMENSGYTLSNIFKGNHLLDLKKNDNSIHAFINDMKNASKDPVIHSLSLTDHSLSFSGLAIFKKDKLVGFSDMLGYYLLSSNVKKVYLSFPCEGKETTFSVHDIRFHTSIQNNSVIHHIKGDITIQENGCNRKVDTKKDILNIKKEAEKIMKKKIDSFLSDQEKWNVHSLDYKSFFFNKKYDSILCKIDLDTSDLKRKEELHE